MNGTFSTSNASISGYFGFVNFPLGTCPSIKAFKSSTKEKQLFNQIT